MKFSTIGRIAALFMLSMASPAFSEPISIRGIDWTMSQDQQLDVLASEGLVCVKEPGWLGMKPPQAGSADMDLVRLLCFKERGSGADVAALRDAYANWIQTCDQAGGSTTECLRHEFKLLRDRLLMVAYREGGSIHFSCEFVGSCDYTVEQIVRELQRSVLNKEFSRPSPEALTVCGKGKEGDRVCVDFVTRAIRLLQNPEQGTMRF